MREVFFRFSGKRLSASRTIRIRPDSPPAKGAMLRPSPESMAKREEKKEKDESRRQNGRDSRREGRQRQQEQQAA
jgi:hypothetical protein